MDTRRPSKEQRILDEIAGGFRTLDLKESPPDEPAFMAPLIRQGDFLAIVGDASSGKTMAAADILLGFAYPDRQGRALGGLFAFNPAYNCEGNVAVVDGENDSARWQSLLRRKLDAEDRDILRLRGRIEYVRPFDVGLHASQEWTIRSRLIAEVLAEKHVRLVIVDSLGVMWGAEDLNAQTWVQRAMVPFRFACQSHGITVVALAHNRRRRSRDDIEPSGPLGSVLQEAQVDALVMMTMAADGRSCRLKLRKSRRAYWLRRSSTISLDFTPEYGYRPQDRWEEIWPHECPDEIRGLKGPGTRDQIFKMLEDAHGGALKSTAIAEALSCTPRTVTTHLNALKDAGRVIHDGSGPSSKWRLAHGAAPSDASPEGPSLFSPSL